MVQCLVTGSTGFIGRFLIARLLKQGVAVTVLLRNPDAKNSKRRVEEWLSAPGVSSNQLSILKGDIADSQVIGEQLDLSIFEHVFHLAAIYDLSADEETVIKTNVAGTEHLLNRLIAGKFQGVFHFISSIAVAGDFEGVFTEDMFDEGQNHPHIYHRSKFESEACVRRIRKEKGIDIRIYRPSAVVGHSQTGEMDKLDGPYYLFALISVLKRWLPRWVPLAIPSLDGTLDIVPVDYVVESLVALSFSEDLNGQYCFHLTNPSSPTLNQLVTKALKAADGPKVGFRIPLGGLRKMGIGMKQLSLVKQLKAVDLCYSAICTQLGLPETVFDALMPGVVFNADKTRSHLTRKGVTLPDINKCIEPMWDYYNRHLDPEKNREALARKAFAGKTVVITGGSSGIGLASAKQALSYGANVILVARHQDKLDEAVTYLSGELSEYPGSIDTFVCDIADSDSCASLLSYLNANEHCVDILFSNAGRSIRRSISKSEGRFHDLERTIQLNYFGAARLALGVLPAMIESGGGHILHSSSMGTMAATPRFGPYMASKAAMDTLMDSMAAEFSNRNVAFTSIKFPLVKTDMVAPTEEFKKAKLTSPEEAAQMFVDAVIDRPRKQLSGMGVFLGTMSLYAPDVVTRIYNYLYQIWPDEQGEFPEMALDRALLTSIVPHSPL